MQEGTRLCFIRIHKIEEAAHPVLRVLKRAVPNFHRDIAIVNAGLHYGVGDPAYRCVALAPANTFWVALDTHAGSEPLQGLCKQFTRASLLLVANMSS